MRKGLFVVLLALLALLVLIPAAAANPPTDFAWGGTPYAGFVIGQLDSQGSPTAPVRNPTVGGDPNLQCPWNDQDYLTKRGAGDIPSLTTVTGNICLVADFDDAGSVVSIYPKRIAVEVFAPSDTLSISLSNDAGNSWQAPPAVRIQSGFRTRLCVSDPVADAHNSVLSSYPEIPGSGGGRGQYVHYTLHLTATKTTHKVVAFLEVHGNGPPATAPQTLSDVPCPPNDGL